MIKVLNNQDHTEGSNSHMNMETETNLELVRKKEKDLAIAFLILTLAFFAVALYKLGINTQYISEVAQLRNSLDSIIIKP